MNCTAVTNLVSSENFPEETYYTVKESNDTCFMAHTSAVAVRGNIGAHIFAACIAKTVFVGIFMVNCIYALSV